MIYIKHEKGEYGYLDERKNKYMIYSIVSLVSVFVFFFTGIIIYHSNKSLFSVIAAVAALPAAKMIIGYIIIFPYHSGNKEIYDTCVELSQDKNAILSCDHVITSKIKTSYITFAFILNGNVVLYSNHKKIDTSYAEKYIKEILNQKCNISNITIYTDSQKFLSRIKALNKNEKMESMDERIAKQLCAYSV